MTYPFELNSEYIARNPNINRRDFVRASLWLYGKRYGWTDATNDREYNPTQFVTRVAQDGYYFGYKEGIESIS